MKIITPRRIVAAVVIVVAGLVLLASRFAGGDTSSPTQARGDAAASSAAASSAQPGGQDTPTPGGGNDPKPTATTGPDDDGGDPILVDPTSQPDVQEAATAFTAAWLNTYGKTAEVWRAALTPRVTPDLAADLEYADPGTVPAAAKAGTAVAVSAEGSLFDATVPVEEATAKGKTLGELRLTIVSKGGRWLVSEIDWQGAGQ